MYYMEDGKRVYTLKKSNPDEKPTNSAHPGNLLCNFTQYLLENILTYARFIYIARFSPDDKWSRERILIKKRFEILPTQLPGKVY